MIQFISGCITQLVVTWFCILSLSKNLWKIAVKVLQCRKKAMGFYHWKCNFHTKSFVLMTNFQVILICLRNQKALTMRKKMGTLTCFLKTHCRCIIWDKRRIIWFKEFVHWEDLEESGGEGGERGDRDGEHM